MLELICDQTYTWAGVPADKSPYRNHGSAFNTTGDFDGFETGSGIIRFPQPDSRVRIPVNQSWTRLIALKIEVLVKVDPKAARQAILVAGNGSFQFGIIEGALQAQFNNAKGTDNLVKSVDAFSPDHKPHLIPANKWVKLGFYHDGFAKMRLFIDGELVGEAIIEGGIPPVQNPGISIGNDVDQDGLQFPGEIDEVQIWRLDPKAMKREFLGRPYTKQAADCWQIQFEMIFDWIKKNPEQFRLLREQIDVVRNSLIRSLLLLSDSDQASLRSILSAFSKLWHGGQLSGPDIKKVLCDWIRHLGVLGIDPGGGPDGKTLADIFAEIRIEAYNISACDRKIASFLTLLREAIEDCGNIKEVSYGY